MNRTDPRESPTVLINPAATRLAPPSAITAIQTRAIPAAAASTAPGGVELTFLVLDVSSSMREPFGASRTKLDAAKHAATAFVTSKGRESPDDQIGVIAFNDSAGVVLPLTGVVSQATAIHRAIQSMQAGGNTDIDTGLRLADEQFDWQRTGVLRRIVLLSDGQGGDPTATAASLRSRGVVIETVGIGASPSAVDEKLLKASASTVNNRLLYRFFRDSQTLIAGFTVLGTRVATRVSTSATTP